jgi:hypothetical protein
MRRWRAALVASVAVGGGCSLILVPKPPEVVAVDQPEPACPEESLAPVIDILVGATPAAAGVILTALCLGSEFCRDENPWLISSAAVGGALGAPFFLSARAGMGRLRGCGAARSRWRDLRAESPERRQDRERGERRALEERCADVIRAWRGAEGADARRQLHTAMPPECRQLAGE